MERKEDERKKEGCGGVIGKSGSGSWIWGTCGIQLDEAVRRERSREGRRRRK